MNLKDVSIVIPAYNEEESLPELAGWIERVMQKENLSFEIIFIDDGSRDKTWQVVQNLQEQHPNIKGIKFRRNYGKSAALNEGFRASNGEVVFTMDADLQDSPEELPELYQMIKSGKFDLVSGWKKKRYDPLSKTIPTKLYNAALRRMSGIKLHDFNCGLKAYDRKVVKSVEVFGEMHRYIPVLAKWAGFDRIGEKIVVHQARKYGKTKFGLERFINGPLDMLSVILLGKFGKRPMHFFGSLGVLVFFIGFIILAYLSISKIWWSETGIASRPLFYFGILSLIIGSQLFLTGFLAELVVRNAFNKDVYDIDEKIGFKEHVLQH